MKVLQREPTIVVGVVSVGSLKGEEMSKQEKIREGMEEIVSDMVYGVGAHYTSREIVAKLQEYEDSQGVVIKVERELPFVSSNYELSQHNVYVKIGNEALREQGFEAVEPLIEVKDDRTTRPL